MPPRATPSLLDGVLAAGGGGLLGVVVFALLLAVSFRSFPTSLRRLVIEERNAAAGIGVGLLVIAVATVIASAVRGT